MIEFVDDNGVIYHINPWKVIYVSRRNDNKDKITIASNTGNFFFNLSKDSNMNSYAALIQWNYEKKSS